MSTLRDEIADIVRTQVVSEITTGDADEHQAADAILAKVREALLDSSVIAHAHKQVNDEYVLPAHLTEGVAAALGAITGEGKS